MPNDECVGNGRVCRLIFHFGPFSVAFFTAGCHVTGSMRSKTETIVGSNLVRALEICPNFSESTTEILNRKTIGSTPVRGSLGFYFRLFPRFCADSATLTCNVQRFFLLPCRETHMDNNVTERANLPNELIIGPHRTNIFCQELPRVSIPLCLK